MPIKKGINVKPKGPAILNNWIAYSKGENIRGIFEYPLFSDSYVTGEETTRFLPYAFLNPVPDIGYPGLFRPIIYVRFEERCEFDVPDMSATDTEAYHGGLLIDEIAAVVSLALGIRVKAGACSRLFSATGDPRGIPIGHPKQPEFINARYRRLVVPVAVGEPQLGQLSPILRIRSMNHEGANALVKAARSFQRALLVAEDDPSLAWLLLVTAVERAATSWKTKGVSSINLLKELEPGLYADLGEFEEADKILSIVAKRFYGQLRSRKKFIDFLLRYLPEPPERRPAVFAQVDWNKDVMEKSLSTIYRHRSNALHEGTPFPQPMCDAPFPFREREGENIWHEKPWALGYAAPGGTWKRSDVPMCLNTFVYIVRGALLEWWKELG